MNVETRISPRFLRGIRANLTFWQQKTADLDDRHVQALEPDFPNLLQLIRMSLHLPEISVETAVLMRQCFFWIENGGHIKAWLPLLQQCTAQLPTAELWLRFQLTKQIGQFQRLLFDLEAAEQTFLECQTFATALNDPKAKAETLINLCQTLQQQKRFDDAFAVGKQALGLLDEKNGRLLSITHQTLGMIARDLGNYDLAAHHLEMALALLQDVLIITDRTRTMTNLAVLYQKQQRYDDALKLLREVQQLCQGTLYIRDQIDVQLNLTSLFYDQKRYAEALEALTEAERLLSDQSGYQMLRAILANNLGCVLRESQQFAAAEKQFHKSIDMLHALSAHQQVIDYSKNLIEAYEMQQKWSEAAFVWEEIINLLDKQFDSTAYLAQREEAVRQRQLAQQKAANE